jgi:hypothetical protein
MGGSSPQMFGVLAALLAVLLHVFTNIGTTFTSTFLPKIFLVEAGSSSTGQSVRFGVYNSCLFHGDALQSCTKPAIGYSNGKAHKNIGVNFFKIRYAKL